MAELRSVCREEKIANQYLLNTFLALNAIHTERWPEGSAAEGLKLIWRVQ